MESYKQKFHSNPSIDPYTNKEITIGGSRFKQLVKEFGTPKIRSPKTGRIINVGGSTYNNLILKNKYTYNNSQLSKPEMYFLPEEIIFEEILMNMDNPNFMSLCKTNKNFYKLCNSQIFWEKMYNKYYSDSGMIQRLPNKSYAELFKICYNLHFIQKTFANPISIANLYDSTHLNIFGGMSNEFIYALQFMDNLTSIDINVNINMFPIVFSNHQQTLLKKIPNLKSIKTIKE